LKKKKKDLQNQGIDAVVRDKGSTEHSSNHFGRIASFQGGRYLPRKKNNNKRPRALLGRMQKKIAATERGKESFLPMDKKEEKRTGDREKLP